MLKKIFFPLLLSIVTALNAQTPSSIEFPPVANPPYVSVDSYTRASNYIRLKPGFHFSGIGSGNATNLLNLNISSYPPYVNNNYTNPSDVPTYYSMNPELDAMVTSGRHSVDNTGVLNYNIPIVCSPGTAGMNPEISINYNSQGENNWLGLGFDLMGISKIMRGGKDLFHDGVKGAIRFNSNDVFNLDGSRLLSTDGINYKHEVDDFSAITFDGTSQSFTIKTPGGLTMEYGKTADSKLKDVGNTVVMAWYLNKVYDEFGNYMTYSYLNSNGEILVDHIYYTGNMTNNLAPYNRIDFTYIDRSDNNSFYFEGKEFRRNKLISEITCLGLNGAVARRYQFDYQYEFASLLSKITEIDGQGNSLNPTYFEWRKTGKSVEHVTNEVMPYLVGPLRPEFSKAVAADLNGDGRKDFILLRNDINLEAGYRLSSWNPPTNIVSPNPYASFSFVPYDPSKTITLDTPQMLQVINYITSFVYDADKDNKEEVYVLYSIEHVGSSKKDFIFKQLKLNGLILTTTKLHEFTVSLNSKVFEITGQYNPSSNFNSSSYFFAYDDVTGDNQSDIIICDETGIVMAPGGGQTITIGASNIVKSGIGDFDGDGVNDIYTLRGANSNSPFTCEVYKYDSSSGTLVMIASTSINLGTNPNMVNWPSTPYPYLANASKSVDFGDFNGDGKTDLLFINYSTDPIGTANLLKSDGVNFLSDSNPLTINTKMNGIESNYSAIDVNNDGYCDLVFTAYDANNTTSYFNYCPSNGNFLIPTPNNDQIYSDALLGTMSDFDGDGALDYLFQTQFSRSRINFNMFNQNNTKMIKRFFNILDNLEVHYCFLPQQSDPIGGTLFYETKVAPTDPAFSRYKPAIHVVAQLTINRRKYYYGYNDAVFHNSGKGFLGFARTGVIDWDRGTMYNRPAVDRSFTYSSTFDAVTKITEKGHNVTGYDFTATTGTEYNYNETDISYTQTGNNRFLSSKTTKSKDYLSGTYNIQTSTFDPNNGGNLLSFRNEYSTYNGQIIRSVQTDYLYQTRTNSFSGGSYFRLYETTTYYTASSVQKSLVKRYAYDSQGHLTQQIENFGTQYQITTDFGPAFNAFGRHLGCNVSGNNINQSRSSSLAYDPTGRFVTQTTNPEGQIESFVYDPVHGTLKNSTDISGLVTKYEYDGWGRLIKTISPTGAVNSSKYTWHQYTDPSYGQQDYGLKIVTNIEGKGEATSFLNFKGNLIKHEEVGFGGTPIVIEKTYELFGERLKTVTDAHFNNQNKFKKISYQWDIPGRPITLTEMDNSNNTIRTINYSYNSHSSTYAKGSCTIQIPAGNGNGNYYKVTKNNEAGQIDQVFNYSNPNALHSANYSFNEFGLPSQVVTSFPGGIGGGTTTYDYDILGRRKTVIDPSVGQIDYAYNSFSELVSVTKANGDSYQFQYDKLGRVIQKVSSGMGTYNYEYYTSGSGIQQLKKIVGPSATTEFFYDSYHRLQEKKESIGNKQFTSLFTYDKYGRMVDYTYPNNFKTTHIYDVYGNLTEIKNNNTSIWQLTAMESPSLFKGYTNSSGLNTLISYDNSLNLQQISLGSMTTQDYTINNKSYNLLNRSYQNSGGSNNESFSFDDFDRIIQSTYQDNQNPPQTHVKADYSYQENGNLAHKTDCGDYNYNDPNHPYFLSQITNPTNNTSFNTLNVVYNDLDKVSQITEASSPGKQFDFVYGNFEKRVKMEYKVNNQLQYTRFYQDRYDREETSGAYRDWSYVYAPTGLAAVYYDNNGTKELLFVNSDHLGSPLMLTDINGQAVEEYSFDAWGRRRDPNNWNNYSNLTAPSKMIRGYTMHEHLDEVGVINMNGRVYDPVLGRFIQPDPLVKEPQNLQNFNRFSYVLNNPLKYDDPSGYAQRVRYSMPSDPAKNPNSPNRQSPVIYLGDGTRMEAGDAGYSMYSTGGGGIGIGSKQYVGVGNITGPQIKGISYTTGRMIDAGATGLTGRGGYVSTVYGGQYGGYTVWRNPVTDSRIVEKTPTTIDELEESTVAGIQWVDQSILSSYIESHSFIFGFMNGPKSDLGSGSSLAGYAGLHMDKTKSLLKYTAENSSDWANKAAKTVQRIGKGFGAAGAVFTAVEGALDGNGFTWGDGVKVGMGVLTTFTPFGWVYGVVDIGFGVFTGTTLTDRIGNGIDAEFE